MDEKCAPSKKFKDGSCFSLKSLQLIAENYNKQAKEKIEISENKEKLVNALETKLKDKCNEQTCWLRLDFVKAIQNPDILENTFRPEGPEKKYEWLSTTDINDVVSQYQEKHKNFLFLGAVPADFEELPVLGIHDLDFKELEKEGKTKIGMVINLDEHDKGGSHWVGLFANLKEGQVYYFDSFAKKPYKKTRKFINKIVKHIYRNKYQKDIKINNVIHKLKNIENFENDKTGGSDPVIKNLNKLDIKYNTIQHQFNNSECGVYSINFVVRLVGGESFEDITNNITNDEKMNGCRKAYFRNVN
jgi:hypothetical protein